MFEFFLPSGSYTILVYRSYTDTKDRAASLWQQSFLFTVDTLHDADLCKDMFCWGVDDE